MCDDKGSKVFFSNSCSKWGTSHNDPLLNCQDGTQQLAVKLPVLETMTDTIEQ